MLAGCFPLMEIVITINNILAYSAFICTSCTFFEKINYANYLYYYYYDFYYQYDDYYY